MNGGELLEFHCVCGQVAKAPDPEEQNWAQIVGYAGYSSMRWHAYAEAAKAALPPWDLLPEAPVAGQNYWLRLDMPFAQQAGDTFWCLYSSPSTYVNGLRNEPDDVGLTCLAACKLLGWQRHGDNDVVGHVAVRETVTLGRLAAGTAFNVQSDHLFAGFDTRYGSVKRSSGYLILDQSIEGDDGSWAILTDSPKPELLLYGVWGSHADYVWAGRGSLGPQLAADLMLLVASID